MLILTILGAILGTRYHVKSIISKKLEASNLKSKAISAAINPHFIKSVINNLYEETKEMNEDEKKGYINSFSSLVNSAYKYLDEENQYGSFGSEIALCDKLVNFYNLKSEHSNNKIQFNVAENLIESKSIPKMLIFNMVENSVTKAFPDWKEKPKKIAICSTNNEIIIEDNGKGTTIDEINKSDGAMQKNRDLITEYNFGKPEIILQHFDETRTKGTQFKITFKNK